MGCVHQAAREKRSRMDILTSASKNLPCICGGRWKLGAEKVLLANGICKYEFQQVVRRALADGAVRGAHVACVGHGGCGKSTLLEPFEEIF